MWDGLRVVLRLRVRERRIHHRDVASGLEWMALIRKCWARNTAATSSLVSAVLVGNHLASNPVSLAQPGAEKIAKTVAS